MTNVLLMIFCGFLISGGLVLVIAGINNPPAERPRFSTSLWKTLVDSRMKNFRTNRWVWFVIWVLAGLILSTITGWALLIVVTPLLGFAVPLLLSAPPNPQLALLEALDRWVRTLSSLLPTGRSISDAIRVSAKQAPPLLAPHLRRLVSRLDDRWTLSHGLAAVADELASPDADAVLAALTLAAQRGGTGATATLAALAENIQDRLRAFREIETERAKPRIVVKQVTIVTLVVLAVAFSFGGEFFAPYASEVGQVLLVVLVVAYLGSLLLLRRMTTPRKRPRILSR